MKPPEVFRTVKQPKGSKICSACCIAMATGFELIRVVQEVGGGENLQHQSKQAEYLARYGIQCGITLKAISGDDPSVDAYSDKSVRMDFPMDVPMQRIDMRGVPAILVVDSLEYPGFYHNMFWDGMVIRDPRQSFPDAMPPEMFNGKIIEVVPLMYYIDEAEYPEVKRKADEAIAAAQAGDFRYHPGEVA